MAEDCNCKINKVTVIRGVKDRGPVQSAWNSEILGNNYV